MTEDVLGIVGSTQAGNFKVERLVGQTPDGCLYRALHGGFRSPVALRCLNLPDSLDATDLEGFLHRFRKEAEVAFRLSASIPELCRPLHVDAIVLPNRRIVPFIAYEWLEGETLAEMIRQSVSSASPLELDALLTLLLPIARALARAHRFPTPGGEVAYVHGDLRPQSILIMRDAMSESARLLDFGFARARAIAGGRGQLGPGELPFTPGYASPEQWRPERFGQLGPWTDVWGIALTLVEALSGAPPIRGDHEMMMSIALDDRSRPTPNRVGGRVSDLVEQVFTMALAVDPRRRFGGIRDFWEALARASGTSLPPFDEGLVTGLPRGSAISSTPPPMKVGTGGATSSDALSLPPPSVQPRDSVGDEFELAGTQSDPHPLGRGDFGAGTAIGLGAPPAPPPVFSPSAPPPLSPIGLGSPLELSVSGPIPRRRTPPPSRPPIEAAPLDERELLVKMRLPGGLFLAAVTVTLIDVLLARIFGYVLPMSMKWISFPLAIAAVAVAVLRFVRSDEGS